MDFSYASNESQQVEHLDLSLSWAIMDKFIPNQSQYNCHVENAFSPPNQGCADSENTVKSTSQAFEIEPMVSHFMEWNWPVQSVCDPADFLGHESELLMTAINPRLLPFDQLELPGYSGTAELCLDTQLLGPARSSPAKQRSVKRRGLYSSPRRPSVRIRPQLTHFDDISNLPCPVVPQNSESKQAFTKDESNAGSSWPIDPALTNENDPGSISTYFPSSPQKPNPAPTRKSGSTADHFCRVNGCTKFSNTPHDTLRHREIHFLGRYKCPNPECAHFNKGQRGLFPRPDSLIRHWKKKCQDWKVKNDLVESVCCVRKEPYWVDCALDEYDPSVHVVPISEP